MRRGLSRVRPGDERGATLVIVALSMVAIFGMVVLTVDLGGLLVKRRSLVNADDAAALAAAEAFARGDAKVGSNEGPAVAQSDAFATKNVGNAVRDDFQATGGIDGASCDPSTCGSVEVAYHGNQSLFFAPVLGFGDNFNVKGTATAIWGPAGGGNPAPIMIRLDWMQDECDEPVPNPDPPTDCQFWLNDHDDNGNPLWSWLNLNPESSNQWGWNVRPVTPGGANYNCPNVGSGDRSRWIHGDVEGLSLNYPDPTYVCTASGHAAANFSDLVDILGQFRAFPANDPSGQVDSNGNYCPVPDCTPDKYDIVGFTILRMDQVLHGDDPDAIGEQAHAGTCNPNHNFGPNPPRDTWDLGTQSCRITNLTYPNDTSKPYPKISKGSTVFVGQVAPCTGTYDYCYDTATHVITWVFPANVNNARVEWDWSTPATEGLCGSHAPDPNAVCLVASWQGFQTGGFDPGGGMDLGLRAIRLSD
jgi:Putative Flp pilus-assembly TadE/G-like